MKENITVKSIWPLRGKAKYDSQTDRKKDNRKIDRQKERQ